MTIQTTTLNENASQVPAILKLYHQLARLPAGKWLFSKILCFKAPYFQSINPRVVSLKPGYSEWHLRKRRKVTNHLGTVHALAMGNLAEMCAGTCIEATLPAQLRWIPKSMHVDYLAKATTNLTGRCQLSAEQLQPGDNVVSVDIHDEHGTRVFHADINMYVSRKDKKHPSET